MISIVITAAIVGIVSFARMFGVRIALPAIKKLDAAVFAALFAACAVIAQKGTNDPPRGASAPHCGVVGGDARPRSGGICFSGPLLITPDPGTGPFTNVAPFEVSNLCFTAICATSSGFSLSAPLHFVSYQPDAYVSGCAWSRDGNGLDESVRTENVLTHYSVRPEEDYL